MQMLLLTSPEDPCSVAALEAAAHGLPIACFAGSGGIPELFGEEAAIVAPYADSASMPDRILALLEHPERRAGCWAVAQWRRSCVAAA